jgi:hypothetical protein
MSQQALLVGNATSVEICNLAKILQLFGIESRRVSVEEFLSELSRLNDANGGGSIGNRIFCCSKTFGQLLAKVDQSRDTLAVWANNVHSAFVYRSGDPKELVELAERLGGHAVVADDALRPGGGSFKVSEEPVSFCGVMAGVTGAASSAGLANCGLFGNSSAQFVDIISTDSGAIFVKLTWHRVPVFLSTCSKVVDLDSGLPNGQFDIRDYVSSALPVVMYLKWAFSGTCWSSNEANACVVIDDPVLKPKHGFVDFRELLSLMKQHRFATSIAFIPWNADRSTRDVIALFNSNPQYYSLSVHGCDHGRAEFGVTDRLQLYAKSRCALERMSEHELNTGIHCDPVMVFPQGVFSKDAVSALKHAGFIAAVNNDTINVGADPADITIRDLWSSAVMRYDSFPIFTRRYPWEGIENFAFDILLGKPAIAVIHHDYFSDHGAALAGFIQQLNGLNHRLNWRGLGELVKRSFRQRTVGPNRLQIDMCATEVCLENRSDRRIQYSVRRRESDPSIINEIATKSGAVAWTYDGEWVKFDIDLSPGESATAVIRFHELGANGCYSEPLSYRTKTMVRRYICEFRDNYVATTKHRFAQLFNRKTSIDRQDRPLTSDVRLLPSEHPDGSISQDNDVRKALINFAQWLDRYGETSWDHQSFFAGPVGGGAKALYYRQKLVGTAAVAPMIFAEAFLPSARRLFHHPTRFSIADAHYAMGFSFLHQATGERAYLDRAIHFLSELEKSRCQGFTDYCWGYPFDWVWRGGVIKRQTPLITTTPYCYEAFVLVAELLETEVTRQRSQVRAEKSEVAAMMVLRDKYEQILASIARHAAYDLKDFPTSQNASSCSYTPSDEGGVINAAAYRAFLLTSASQMFSNSDYQRIAERNLNFVLENQNPDGSWYYATDGVRDFVDHYHTCFVMKALAKIHTLTSHSGCLQALSKGVDYYLGNLFGEDGLPKPFSKAPRLTVYKRELYDCAECVNLCLLLRDRFPELQQTLDAVVAGVLRHWIKPDGSFRSRRLHLGWDNVPMHRWGQSQMFRALAFYFRDAGADDRGRKTDDSGRITKRVRQSENGLVNIAKSGI